MTKEEAISELKRLFKGERNPMIYSTIRHVAPSGMSRSISFYFVNKNRQPIWLDHLICRALDYKLDDKREAVKVSGCGMDIGFEVVYNLSTALYGYKNEQSYRLKQVWL